MRRLMPGIIAAITIAGIALAGQFSHQAGMSAVVSLSPAAVMTITCADTTTSPAALTNAQAGSACFVGAPSSFVANMTLPQCFVSATGTIKVRFCNPTLGSLTPTSGNYHIQIFNP